MEEVRWKYRLLTWGALALMALAGCGVTETDTPSGSSGKISAAANHSHVGSAIAGASGQRIDIRNTADIRTDGGWTSTGHARIDATRHYEYSLTIDDGKIYGVAVYHENALRHPYNHIIFHGNPDRDVVVCVAGTNNPLCGGGAK